MICDNCIYDAVCERATFNSHCDYKHTEADIINPELEKIRKEIENDQEQMVNEKDFGKYYGMGWAIRIIDKHISELKGEK